MVYPPPHNPEEFMRSATGREKEVSMARRSDDSFSPNCEMYMIALSKSEFHG